jgi:hypothetical protein
MPPEVLPPIIAARDWLIGQPHWEPQRPLIDRLAKASIWKQLNKRDPIMSHLQLARWSTMWAWGGVLNGSDRDIATQIVFLNSVYVDPPVETSAVAEYQGITNSFRAQAKRLRLEAEELEEARRRLLAPSIWRGISFSPAPDDSYRAQALRLINLRDHVEEYAQAIQRAAAWCEAEAHRMMAIASDPNHPDYLGDLIVDRHQEPPHVRAYCILLSKITRLLYGDVLRGVIARVATVALNHTVSPANVRYWCENKSA